MDFSGQSGDSLERKRILVVASRVPKLPLLDGYVLHLWHLLMETAGRAEVELVVLGESDGADTLPGVRVTFAGSHRGLRREVERVASRFDPDVVHVVGGPLAHVWRSIPAEAASVLGALDAAHLNVESRLDDGVVAAARALVRRGLILWRIRRSYRRFDSVVVVSDEDRQALKKEDSRIELAVIPNGVDLSLYAPQPGVDREPARLLFTGALDYAPNVATAEFLAREVMPLVRTRCPSAALHIVGRDPSDHVKALGGLPGVTVVGPIEHMTDALSRASVYVCPMVSGTGIKNKLLEAMANGLPCVGSRLAVRGMNVTDGDQVLIADSAQEVADAVLRVLDDDELRVGLALRGQTYVTVNHTWAGMAGRYGTLYRSLIAD